MGTFPPNHYDFLLSLVMFCIGSAFQCGAMRLTHLFVGRALGGVGVGALRLVKEKKLSLKEVTPKLHLSYINIP